MARILDCGHYSGACTWTTIHHADGTQKPVRGWGFTHRDGKDICYACADNIILDCGHHPSPHESFTTGYGSDRDGKTFCYACAAEKDREQMRRDGKICLYLAGRTVTNWPGSLKIEVDSKWSGRHNIAGKRYDVRFTFEGQTWHGVTYGDNTQICHCRRIKG